MSYYYLAASLPELILGEAPPFGLEQFVDRSSCLLDKDDLQELELVLAGEVARGRTPFSRRWFNAETQLRNAVARIRAGFHGVEPRNIIRDHEGFDLTIEKAVTSAFTSTNPMEKELALDRHRWQILDELARMDRFGLPAILSFVLKLQIVERWWAMDDDTGHDCVDDVVRRNIELNMPRSMHIGNPHLTVTRT